MSGVHHGNAIYVVCPTRMRFNRCTPYKSPKGAIYVDSNANYAVHTAQLAQGPLPRHAHRSLPGPLSRDPGHDRAQMIIFRTESTTFGRRIWRHSFGRFPGSSCTKCPKGKGPWKRLVHLISSGGQTCDGSGRAGRGRRMPCCTPSPSTAHHAATTCSPRLLDARAREFWAWICQGRNSSGARISACVALLRARSPG